MFSSEYLTCGLSLLASEKSEIDSQIRLNLSASCGCQLLNQIYGLFLGTLFRQLHDVLRFIKIDHSTNVKIFKLPQRFTFQINFLMWRNYLRFYVVAIHRVVEVIQNSS